MRNGTHTLSQNSIVTQGAGRGAGALNVVGSRGCSGSSNSSANFLIRIEGLLWVGEYPPGILEVALLGDNNASSEIELEGRTGLQSTQVFGSAIVRVIYTVSMYGGFPLGVSYAM